jgi:hypothetical protein
MVEHANAHGHPIAMSMLDLSFWCYACDTYIINQVRPSRAALFSCCQGLQYIAHMASKSLAPPMPPELAQAQAAVDDGSEAMMQ